jgi:hypothetical protein
MTYCRETRDKKNAVRERVNLAEKDSCKSEQKQKKLLFAKTEDRQR